MSLPVIANPSSTSEEKTTRPHLLSWTIEELSDWLGQHGHRTFRAKQIWRWIYQGRASSFEQMTDLPARLRQQLEQSFELFIGVEVTASASRDGTEKLLVRLSGGGEIECVLLRDGSRRSICVSSQV
ncbi:MAG: 23S rRNA (adenine(2503)-C(2))-methyltransferase RlmN, partial [Planctomycetota bacterium]